MTLKIVGNLYGEYHQRLVKNVNMTSTEVGIVGMPYDYSATAQWTVASYIIGSTVHPHIPIRGISVAATTSSTSASGSTTPVIELVKPFDIIEADYTGTASTDFIAGALNIKLSTAGTSTSSTGAVPLVLSTSTNIGSTAVLERARILEVNSDDSKVRFYFDRLTT